MVEVASGRMAAAGHTTQHLFLTTLATPDPWPAATGHHNNTTQHYSALNVECLGKENHLLEIVFSPDLRHWISMISSDIV